MRFKQVIATFAGLSALAVGGLARSENWIYTTDNGFGSEYYFDSESVKISSPIVSMWVKIDAKKDNTVKYRQKILRFEYNCSNDTWSLNHSTTYNARGAVTETLNYEDDEIEWKPAIPGSIGDLHLKVACLYNEKFNNSRK